MSCEMRSTITAYPLGSASFTPPTCTNSARMSSTSIELMRSTSAPGNVFSIPNSTPIFFISHSSTVYISTVYCLHLQIHLRHPVPPRPVVTRVISPHIQLHGNASPAHCRGQPLVVVPALIVHSRRQHIPAPAHLLQDVSIMQIRQKVQWQIEVHVVVVVPAQKSKALQVERSAHRQESREHIRMSQRAVHCVKAAKAAPGRYHVRLSIVMPNERHNLIH